MKYKSVFDIIGPVMVGPSSSHTAGAARIGLVARKLFGRKPEWAHISFYGSFAETYRGHGTDVAIVAGLLGFDTFDDRLPNALEIARIEGLDVSFSRKKRFRIIRIQRVCGLAMIKENSSLSVFPSAEGKSKLSS